LRASRDRFRRRYVDALGIALPRRPDGEGTSMDAMPHTTAIERTASLFEQPGRDARQQLVEQRLVVLELRILEQGQCADQSSIVVERASGIQHELLQRLARS
jgi:hypothetical protein